MDRFAPMRLDDCAVQWLRLNTQTDLRLYVDHDLPERRHVLHDAARALPVRSSEVRKRTERSDDHEANDPT
jgi:hypothetical protein